MQRFINKVLFTSLPVLTLLIVVNYFGDSARIYDSGYERGMAEIIINGNFVTNISNYDDRIFQKELIDRMNSSPEVLVLGSSRTMLINSDYFPNHTFFNNSVSGASMEDIIALFQIYKERNFSPSKIIIGIDPWLFNENNGQSRWQSLKYFYYKYKNKTDSKVYAHSTYKYSELFSLSYFQASLKEAPKLFLGASQPISTQTKYNETNTKLLDGSLVYGEDYRNATQNIINSRIKQYINGNIYSIEKFDRISDDIWAEFQDFIFDLKKKNISVEFLLCPYAPVVFDKISKDYPNVLKTENIIVDFAYNNKIKVYGSFNPNNLGLDETYFYDGMHCKEKGIEQLLGAVK